MQREIANQTVDVDAEGYLTDMNQWNREIAAELATELRVAEMTDRHWAVVEWLREQKQNDEELNIRKVGKSGVVDIKEFYQLFPGGPLKNASKIAGLPKPTSCL